MRQSERLYTSLISRGLHRFKESLTVADTKDERVRNEGKGEVGETSYISIIPVACGSWCQTKVCEQRL